MIRAGARALVASNLQAKKNAEALIARLFELDRRTKADFYEMGLLLRELKKPVHLRALGFEKWEELLAKRRIPKRAMAYRLVAVVENVDRDTANTIGVERSYHAIKYLEATKQPMKPRSFIRPERRLRIGQVDYELRTIPTRVLKAAVESIKKGVPLEPPPQLEKTTRAIAQRLDNLGIEARRVASHYRAGESEITLHLPLAEAQKLFALLRR